MVLVLVFLGLKIAQLGLIYGCCDIAVLMIAMMFLKNENGKKYSVLAVTIMHR